LSNVFYDLSFLSNQLTCLNQFPRLSFNKCVNICVSTDVEWHGSLCVVIAWMLNAGCTDAGHNSTFCLMPIVYISHKTLTIIWAIQSKLPASLTKANCPLSVLELY